MEKRNPNIGQVEIRAFPIFDESGNVALVMEHIRDITALKHAEDVLRQAKEEWERTFDAIVDPVMIADTQHKIVKANRAMADILGISPAAAEGLACFKAVHNAAEPPLFCPHSKLLADGLPHSIEIYEERLGGYFIVSVSPIFNSIPAFTSRWRRKN
jgi:PAS domain S-box-containing protein